MAGWPPLWALLSSALLFSAPSAISSPLKNTAPQEQEIDSPHTRKLLGSSVVTSVSVIMDHGNGTKTYITDAYPHSKDATSGQLGRPPQIVGTPGTLLAPDRYEFYTFGREGELVKKLMTLDQIQSLIAAAGGEDDDDLSDQPVYYHQPLVEAGDSEGVSKVLESVHNVLKGELEAAAAAGQHSGEVPLLPDQSWTILLPGLLNNDMDLKEPFQPKKPSPTTTRPSSTVTKPAATTRFPPRRTTTNPTTTTQHIYRPTTSNYNKATQTVQTNQYTTSANQQQQNQQQQLVASPSILSPQYSSNKEPTNKPVHSSAGILTTVKYSAHYTTPHPTVPSKHTTHYVKPQQGSTNKPGAISVKKPVLGTVSSSKPISTTSASKTTTPIFTTPLSTSKTQSTTAKRTTTAPPITTYKGSTISPIPSTGTKLTSATKPSRNVTKTPSRPATYKPLTTRPQPQPIKYTEIYRPSGIPTIVHYLPMYSMSPSHAPVPTNPPKFSDDKNVQNVSNQYPPTTTQKTTTRPASSVASTTKINIEEISVTTPASYKEIQKTVQTTNYSNYPSTTSISTKNHYTITDAVKSSPSSTATKATQATFTTKHDSVTQTTLYEPLPSSSPLISHPSSPSQQNHIKDDSSNTVSVVTVFEDTTKPIEIVTTAGKLGPSTISVTTDKLIQQASTVDKEEAVTNSEIPIVSVTTLRPTVDPSTIMVQVVTRPTHRNSTTSTLTKTNSIKKPTKRPVVVHRRPVTTTTTSPPRRGSVTYTPVTPILLNNSTIIPTRQPVKPSNTYAYTKTTGRPDAATLSHSSTVHRRPIPSTTTTSTTTKRPTTTLSTTLGTTTTTIKPTEFITTTALPTETTTFFTKMPLDEIPLKLYEDLKEDNKPQLFELPSTVTEENYSTIEQSTTTTSSNTETISAETTYDTVATVSTPTPYPNRVVIVNNSEPIILKQGISEEELVAVTSDNIVSELGEKTNSPVDNQGTSVYTTVPTTVELSTLATETTTTMDHMSTFKDQVLEEGISAVTSILLEGEQKKEFLLNMTRPLGIFNQTLTTTTGRTEEDTDLNATSVTEQFTSTIALQSEEKSETRLNEVELTEGVTEEWSTQKSEVQNVTEISTESPFHNQVKKHVQNELNKNITLKETENITANKNIKKDKNDTKKGDELGELKKEVKGVADTQNNVLQATKLESQVKSPPSTEPKKSVHAKPISQEVTKKPIQQDSKKQSNDETKKPVKSKPTTQSQKFQEKSTNSTKVVVKDSETSDDDDDDKIPVKLEMKSQPNDELKKLSSHIVPTKESKLNPDIVDEPSQLVEIPQHDPASSIAPPVISVIPVVTTERAIVHEQIKLQEVDKTNTGINKYSAKRPPYQTPQQELTAPPAAIELHPAPYESMGLEASTAFLAEDVRRFADLCNELAFKLWTALTSKGQISSRSLVMSPFAVTSLLAMVFLGARGATSGQMNDILRLDDMVTFNPHQVLQNVTESVLNSKNKGVATAAFVRELYSDKSKGKLLDFYKERAQQYYQGHVEEINFSTVGDIIRRRTNLLVKRQTLGKVAEYLRGSSLNMKPPLAAFSANIFQTDCELGSTEGRDGEMYFVVRPSTRQRRLVPVPAVVWRQGFLAGYEPGLDATSVCLGPDSIVSTILILPGQQGQVAPGDGLSRLEQRLIESSYRRGAWSRLLRSQLPRPGLELQVPRFSHRSVLNVTGALTRMGLRDLFGTKADLRGLNGLSNDLHLSDMVQVNTFSTCGEETVGARHHIETYPASPQRTGRDEPQDGQSSSLTDTLHDYSHNMQQQWDTSVPLAFRPRQARLPDNPRLRFDRPFLYVVRHNPSGIILHVGRFNPRLLP